MRLSRFNILLRLFVSLTLSASTAQANAPQEETTTVQEETKTVLSVTEIVRTEADGTQSDLQINVTAIETNNEPELLAEMAAQSENGIVVLTNIAVGEDAAESPLFEATQFIAPPKKTSVLSRLGSRVSSLFKYRPSDRIRGLLVSVSSSSIGASGAYFLADSSLEHSVYLSAAMLAVGTLQAAFTKQWGKYLNSGGNAALSIGKFVAKVLNKKPEAKDGLKKVGQIVAAAAFNVVATSGILLLTESYQGLLIAAIVGTLGAYDYTVDIYSQQLKELGRINDSVFNQTIQSRVFVGPILETLSLAGFAPAQLLMGAIGLSGLWAIYKGEGAYDTILKSRGKIISFALNSKKVGTLVMDPGQALKLIKLSQPKNCASILMLPSFRQYRLADDIQ